MLKAWAAGNIACRRDVSGFATAEKNGSKARQRQLRLDALCIALPAHKKMTLSQ